MKAGGYMSNHRERYLAILFALFGLSSWIILNSIFVEVSQLFRILPEGREIAAYTMFVLQAANAFPIAYMVFNSNEEYLSVSKAIVIVLTMGILVCVLLSTFWDYTAMLLHHTHSTVFFSLVFLGGAVSGTTNIVYYSFVSAFPPHFTTALATGEGCGGVISGILGLIQDPGGAHLRFSVSTFFLCSAGVFVLSAVAFYVLTHHPWAIALQESYSNQKRVEQEEGNALTKKSPLLNDAKYLLGYSTEILPQTTNLHVKSEAYVKKYFWKLLVIQLCICAFSYGFVPSAMPYFCNKFQHGSEVLKWSSTLSMAFDPLGRILTGYFQWYHIPILTTTTLGIGTFMVYEALMPVSPLFQQYEFGGAFAVICNCAFVLSFAYTQTMLYLTMKHTPSIDSDIIRVAYQWSGFCTQIGGMIGSLIVFPIIVFVLHP